jgi:hypothetical protein
MLQPQTLTSNSVASNSFDPLPFFAHLVGVEAQDASGRRTLNSRPSSSYLFLHLDPLINSPSGRSSPLRRQTESSRHRFLSVIFCGQKFK